MSDPTIYDKKPIMVDLEEGVDYFFCTCGRSEKQPFCNGSHQGSEFTPLKFSVHEDKRAALCQCKHTGNAPYCDGSHTKL